MKKYFIPFLVLGTTLLYSCAKEEVTSDTDSSSSVEKVKMEFKAGIDAMSRTVLTTNNFVEWEAGDAISLFDSNNNEFTTSTGGASVTFTGLAQDNLETYYALYPYNEKATISDGEIITTLSAEQTALEGSFAKMLNPSVAKSGADKLLNFKNACAVVKFTLGTGVTNVVKAMFRGNDGESLAGTLNINVSGNAPVTTVETGEGTGVTLRSNERFVIGTDYYFVVAPLELKKGITLVLYDSNGKEWKRRGGNPVKLTAGHILDLGTITTGEFKEVVHISTANDLVSWAARTDKLTTDVVLDADIDMNDQAWTPVGSSMTAGEGYSGNFDGNGKTITNLTVSGTGNVGFFGGLAEGGKVHDLKFSDATITGDGSSYAGVVAGANLGIIDNCNVSNSKVSGNNAGAITGNNSVQVNNCNVQDVTINGNYLAGGISAYNYGKIEYCTVSGDNTQIKATGSSSRAGGIVASNSEENNVSTSGRLLKCAVEKANISGVWAGGIAGENAFGTVAQCVVDRSVIIHESGQNSTRLGGVVGYNARGEVVASYSAYTTVGAQDLNSEAMGGIVGYNYSSSAYVYGCYSTHVSLLGNAGNNIGAIAGYNNGHVTSCYAVLPENVSDINLVGNNIATSGIDHCVEVGGNNYTELENASDLTVTDGTVWKAAKIWEITASGVTPTINVNYIGEAGTN
ncbi:hypothetical protein QVN91_02615 [Bacteroides caecigallinarum]|nr:hypothetical protein [Bacteroides caecigallinarum]